MALNPSSLGSVSETHPIVVSALLAAVVVAAMLVLTAVLGIQGSGPSLDIVPDPAGLLPF